MSMTELEQQCLDTFPQWLNSLADDARDLAAAIADDATPDATRRYAVVGLNYLFKSLDLIPDGIEDLGYLDDAFVLRVAAARAVAEAPESEKGDSTVARLAKDTALIEGLLEADYARLEAYVETLKNTAARGRTVDDIVGDESVRRDFLNEVSGWATSYECPSFNRDEKNLVKLKSFLRTKLP
jgi:uncharacterized membrane protein YkvA (DUF1232 family)